MGSSLLSGIAGGLLAAALLRFCVLRARPSILGRPDGEGWRHVGFGLGYRAVVLVAAICGLVMTLAASYARPEQNLAVLVVCTSFSLLAIYALYATFLRTIRFDRRTLQSLHPGMIREIALGDIVEVRPYAGLGYARVVGREGDSIWLPRTGAYRLLVRYVRCRARAAFLDKTLARTRIDWPAGDNDDAASLAVFLSARHGRTVSHAGFADLAQGGPWFASNRIKSSGVVVVVTDGQARLSAAGRYTWTMRRGDCLLVPRAVAKSVLIAPLAGTPAKLALYDVSR